MGGSCTGSPIGRNLCFGIKHKDTLTCGQFGGRIQTFNPSIKGWRSFVIINAESKKGFFNVQYVFSGIYVPKLPGANVATIQRTNKYSCES